MYKFNLDFFLMLLHFDAIAMVKKKKKRAGKKSKNSQYLKEKAEGLYTVLGEFVSRVMSDEVLQCLTSESVALT